MTLADRALLLPFRKYSNVSHYSVTNLIIWSATFNTHFCIENGVLFLRGNNPGQSPIYYAPLGEYDLTEVIKKLESEFSPITLMPLSLEFKSSLECDMPGCFEFTRHEELEDYLYLTERLISLSGKKLHAKRNHINKFLREHPVFEYYPMSGQNAHECLSVEREWLINKEGADSSAFEEHRAIEILVENFDVLELKGAFICINGRKIAFTIGEYYNGNAHIIIEKADTSYDGAYTMIAHEFLMRELGDTKLTNREEDLGIAGLRTAKRSYDPISFNEVYSAVRK